MEAISGMPTASTKPLNLEISNLKISCSAAYASRGHPSSTFGKKWVSYDKARRCRRRTRRPRIPAQPYKPFGDRRMVARRHRDALRDFAQPQLSAAINEPAAY
jgi:hypothetical protein